MEETLPPDSAGAWGLSASTSLEAYRALRADRSRWLPIALDIARSHGLDISAPHVFSTGTNLVVGARREADPENLPAAAARAIRLRARLADAASRAGFICRSPRSSRRASATAGLISSSRALPARSARRCGRRCRKRRRSACCARSARPSPPCSARRSARSRRSSRAGTTSCARRCRAAARGTRVSALRRNSSPASTISCATRPSSFRWTRRR